MKTHCPDNQKLGSQEFGVNFNRLSLAKAGDKECFSHVFKLLFLPLLILVFSLSFFPAKDAEALTLCYCHNICAVDNTQCTSESGQQNGHQKSVNCHECLVLEGGSCPGDIPEACDDDCETPVEDTFGKCSGCGSGVTDDEVCISDFCTNGDPCTLDSDCEGTEQCDDGNNENGDGCDEDCQLECTSNADCPSDGNPCTDDICNTELESPRCVNVNNSADCDDGLFCTENDECSGGECNGTPKVCLDDGIECTVESCNELNDLCEMDNSFCECETDLNCEDMNPCTENICDPSTLSCIFPVNTDLPCDDGMFCNGTESCNDQGQCVSTGDPCEAVLDECANVCDEDSNTCNLPQGTGCTDDGNACTDDQCNGAGECVQINNSADCDDEVNCTENDVCSGGECNGTPIVCEGDGIECTVESCNESNGECETDDSNCECETDLDCEDMNPCTDNVCDPSSRSCTFPVNTENSCDDGTFCNGTESCNDQGQCDSTGDPCAEGPECGNVCDEEEGTCNLAAGISCTDDGNPCTDNECDGEGECAPVNNEADCEDGDACTLDDVCSEGECGPGTPKVCSDGRSCSSDSCDSDSGQCLFDLSECACDADSECDDDNVCTEDSCDESGGACVNAPLTNVLCDNGILIPILTPPGAEAEPFIPEGTPSLLEGSGTCSLNNSPVSETNAGTVLLLLMAMAWSLRPLRRKVFLEGKK